MEGAGRGGEARKGNACPQSPNAPLTLPQFDKFIAWQLVNKVFVTNNRSPDDTNLLPSKSKQTPGNRFRIFLNFTVEFWTLSQPRKSGLVSSEKDSYGTILANLCRAVGVEVVQNLELFSDRVPVQFLRSKNRNLGALFEVIRNAIGSESAVSQTPPKQSINLCKRLLQSPWSGNSPCFKNVRVDSSLSEKASRKSLRSAVGSGQKWSSWVKPEHQWFTNCRGTSGKNSDSQLVWESHTRQDKESNQFIVFMRVTLKWTYLIWLTDLSLGNQHYHAAPIRKLRSWTNGFFKIMGFAGKRFLSSLPLPPLGLFFFALAPIFARSKKPKILQTWGKPYGNACYAG